MVPPEPAGIADAIGRVMSDISVAQSVGFAGRQRLRGQFDPQVNGQALLDLFVKVRHEPAA